MRMKNALNKGKARSIEFVSYFLVNFQLVAS